MKNESTWFSRVPTLAAAAVILVAALLEVVSAGLADTPGSHSEATEGANCEEHDVKEDECGICHPDLAADLAPGRGLKIRFASAESAARAGILVATSSEESLSVGIECYAEIVFDENRTAHVASPVDGIIEEVRSDLGRRVRRGDTLVALASAAVAEARGNHSRAVAEWRLRDAAHERETRLRDDRISSEKDVQEAAAARDAARAVLDEATERLRVLGLDPSQAGGSADGGASGAAALEIRSPISGEVIFRDAVRGVRVAAGQRLFVVADPSVMWGMIRIPERELSRVRPGQRVEFTLDGGGARPVAGTLTWVSSEVDPRSRMATARAEIENGTPPIRSGAFARAWIETGARGTAIVVPEEAVQPVANRPFVFVRLEDDLFEARAVALGAKRNGRVEVTDGLRTGEELVVAGSYVVKSELLKSRLGAGCVDD